MNVVKELSNLINEAPKEITDNCFRQFFKQDQVQMQNQLYFFYYYLLQFENHDELKEYLMEEFQLVNGQMELDLEKVPESRMDLIKIFLFQLFSPLIQAVLERKIKEINQNAAEQEIIMHPFKAILDNRDQLIEQIESLEKEVSIEQDKQNQQE